MMIYFKGADFLSDLFYFIYAQLSEAGAATAFTTLVNNDNASWDYQVQVGTTACQSQSKTLDPWNDPNYFCIRKPELAIVSKFKETNRNVFGRLRMRGQEQEIHQPNRSLLVPE